MNRKSIHIIAISLLSAIFVTSCGSVPASTTPNESDPVVTTDAITDAIASTEEIPATTDAPVVVVPSVDEYGFTEEQRNSFAMLYHLSITAEKIRISKDNRLILDDIYTSLLNDINPGAIDETTQDHLESLRDVIKAYINISTKRERLQYIYNQNKASSIRSAVPNPLAILSMASSFNWKQLVVSTAFTFVDSYNNYKISEEATNMEYLMSGWELDDEEMATIQRNREKAFDYMVDIVQEYHLDGKLTLNENAIETFAEICTIESIPQKTRRLESEESTYKLLGNYWLELANCYYETAEYQKCLDSIAKYKALSTGIYRKDYNYVQILPKVIVAAQETYSGEAYISNISTFANDILENTTTDEWSIRYFAAQVYLDLYAKTNNNKYLETAYNIAYDNVTILLDEQRKLNATYLANVKEETISEPDYRYMTASEKTEAEKTFKEEQKRIKAYNKQLKANRKTELVSMYEPLILNCDLLFALAEKMNITDKEKTKIEAILQTSTNGVFLAEPINNHYSFHKPAPSHSIEFTKSEIVIPASILVANSVITVKVTDNGKTETFTDCVVTSVDRKATDIESF